QLSVGPPQPALPPEPDEWMRRFSTLPLMCQPGERWLYHTGSDVLGVLIARATDQPFETFLRERILEPLGMKDTAFSVPPADVDPGDFDARGWGFGVGMATRREHPAVPVGQYGWDGGLGTIWRNDPSEQMITILMTNAAWTSPSPPDIALDFLTGAYAAIDD